MTKQVIPTKTIVNRKQTNVLSKKDEYQQHLLAIEQVKALQNEIEFYNMSVQNGEIPIDFDSMRLVNGGIVVKLYKEDFIKQWIEMTMTIDDEGNTEKVMIPYGSFSQVDGRKRTSDVEQYIDTPLPYIFKGKIMAISQEARTKLEEQTGLVVHPGTFVTINETVLRDRRFYINKQKQRMDHIANQREVVLNNFEGYFIFNTYDIESIITDILLESNA